MPNVYASIMDISLPPIYGTFQRTRLPILSQNRKTETQTKVRMAFKNANRSKGQGRLDYILTKQADRRLIRFINVPRPPLEAPESDHNLVYAKVRIPRRSAPNRRKRDRTKKNSEAGRP